MFLVDNNREYRIDPLKIRFTPALHGFSAERTNLYVRGNWKILGTTGSDWFIIEGPIRSLDSDGTRLPDEIEIRYWGRIKNQAEGEILLTMLGVYE